MPVSKGECYCFSGCVDVLGVSTARGFQVSVSNACVVTGVCGV
jgi:hypothetical protein